MFARFALRGIAGLFVVVTLLAGADQPALAATITVNSTGDGSDATPGDGTCETLVSGECTLRAAIEEANFLPGTDVIGFNISPGGLQTITPSTALPPIQDTVIIDGPTQPGFAGSPIIELDGSSAGPVQAGLELAASNSTVRGLVINQFSGSGIWLHYSDNLVEGNFIGTDPTGALDLGNGGTGVVLQGANHTVGGATAAARNVISGNGRGVEFFLGSATGGLVQGNFIGTDASGSTDLGNDEFGVLVGGGSSDNTIGGTSTGERNVISGNKSGGVLIITDAVDNVVEGNFVGTDVSGTLDLGNGNFGVLSAPNNTIGGTTGTTPGGPCTGSCNLISGNDFRGVSIGGPGVVQGNFIGTDVSGTLDLGNSVFGLSVGGSGSVIGGTTPAARNVISGNGEIGIDIGGSGHLVQGNFIGTNAAGTGAIGNGAGGVFDAGVSLPNGASSNTIGGTAPGARNLISGNNRSGVSMTGGTGNMVQGNFIGTDITGSLSLGNVLDGVIIWLNASGNTVGGTATGARNVISGNSRDGVEIFNAGATGNLIQGNSIGTQADGSSPLGNGSSGVVISDAPGNTVGGTSAAASNTIAFNGVFFGAGVFVGSGTGNGILGNSIFSNFSQGIDLSGDGVTANDAGDGDTGPNNLQNFPVLTSAVSKSGAVKIGGSLSSTRKTNFTVEFFANAACDSSGHGEGERFLGRQVLKTDVSGNTKISASFKAAVAPGEVVTATATDPSNNTSEFSQCRVVTAK